MGFRVRPPVFWDGSFKFVPVALVFGNQLRLDLVLGHFWGALRAILRKGRGENVVNEPPGALWGPSEPTAVKKDASGVLLPSLKASKKTPLVSLAEPKTGL